ncbi:MAG: hypothetical protein A2Y38_03400 [Spirochaetes bacterium GWB1_59_5]|nr:MAG: hypothetical protein A2Y38_03400 [Spirochaetes bacterium GWB1_59_5]
MNTPDSRRAFHELTIVAVAASLLLTSCATIVKAPVGIEPERFLPAGALAYARLDQATLSAAMALLLASEAKSAATIAARTDSMTAAFVKQPGSSRGGLVAVAEGRYPAGAASFKLASDPSWHRNGQVWERKDGSLNLAFADGGRVFLGTAPLDGLLAAAAAPNPDPIPARWADEWAASIAVFLPNPMALMRSRLPLGDGDVPMVAMMLSARRATGSDYTASLSFEFQSERTAIIFAPLCRLFLYAAATALWPERSATVIDEAVWGTSGNTVTARDIPLDAASIAGFATMAGN